MVFPDMSQPALTRTTMANEGPATGAANNGPHEVNPDPSKGNVDAPHQRAETSSILGNLERMTTTQACTTRQACTELLTPTPCLGN